MRDTGPLCPSFYVKVFEEPCLLNAWVTLVDAYTDIRYGSKFMAWHKPDI